MELADQMPPWVKKLVVFGGLVLALPGVPMLVALCCVVPLVVLGNGTEVAPGLASLTLVAVTCGGGLVVALQGQRSLQGKSSNPLRLPIIWALAGIFGLLVAVGLFVSENEFASGLFLPPILLVAAALPPLWAVSWFTNRQAEGLTWRRGLVAFTGGATVSVVIALALEILMPVVVFALVLNLGQAATRSVQALLDALAGKDIASAMTNPGFIYVFVEIALIAPLAEEFAKPLVALPLLGRLTRRDAFLVAAMAGAGFAALENVLYAGFGYYFWGGILVVRAVGGAIHPLGAGLVGVSWRDILKGEPNAWRNGLVRFGLAAGMHALWNGGSLIVVTLAGAHFFGQLPPEINVLGLSAAGTTLAFLIVLGLAALWMGRAITQRAKMPGLAAGEPTDIQFTLSDRTVAIWALACLVAIVPAGITGLQLLVR